MNLCPVEGGGGEFLIFVCFFKSFVRSCCYGTLPVTIAAACKTDGPESWWFLVRGSQAGPLRRALPFFTFLKPWQCQFRAAPANSRQAVSPPSPDKEFSLIILEMCRRGSHCLLIWWKQQERENGEKNFLWGLGGRSCHSRNSHEVENSTFIY